MKIKTAISGALKQHYYIELQSYRKAFVQSQWQQAWGHLERADIVGQAYHFEHTQVRLIVKTKP